MLRDRVRSVTVSASVYEEEAEKVALLAELDGVSRSYWIAEAIRAAIDKRLTSPTALYEMTRERNKHRPAEEWD